MKKSRAAVYGMIATWAALAAGACARAQDAEPVPGGSGGGGGSVEGGDAPGDGKPSDAKTDADAGDASDAKTDATDAGDAKTDVAEAGDVATDADADASKEADGDAASEDAPDGGDVAGEDVSDAPDASEADDAAGEPDAPFEAPPWDVLCGNWDTNCIPCLQFACPFQIIGCGTSPQCSGPFSTWTSCMKGCGDPAQCTSSFQSAGGQAADNLVQCAKLACQVPCGMP